LIATDDLPCMQVLTTARSALEEQARQLEELNAELADTRESLRESQEEVAEAKSLAAELLTALHASAHHDALSSPHRWPRPNRSPIDERPSLHASR